MRIWIFFVSLCHSFSRLFIQRGISNIMYDLEWKILSLWFMNQNNTLRLLFSDLRYRIHHVEICIRLLWKPQSYTNIGLISEQQHRWSNDRIERRCWRNQNISETTVRNLFFDIVIKHIFFVLLLFTFIILLNYNMIFYSIQESEKVVLHLYMKQLMLKQDRVPMHWNGYWQLTKKRELQLYKKYLF